MFNVRSGRQSRDNWEERYFSIILCLRNMISGYFHHPRHSEIKDNEYLENLVDFLYEHSDTSYLAEMNELTPVEVEQLNRFRAWKELKGRDNR